MGQSTQLTRRDFLWLASVSSAGILTGCATNPVTGNRQFMLVSEAQEIQLDKEHSPHQFSSDFGRTQDAELNHYLDQVGHDLAARSHRPDMPYSFQAVNASYVNAYAFPGGSVAATRGILLELENEAELAGLFGHEIGHVNARHTGERMSKGLLASLLVTGAAIYAESQDSEWTPLISLGGNLAAGALLAHYSRDDEREADALGMEYMTRLGYDPEGMVGLMEVLVALSKHKPSALDMMFATHPMSEERLASARKTAHSRSQSTVVSTLQKERYMDHTARLRSIRDAIESLQGGEEFMGQQRYSQAEGFFRDALRVAPNDYAALMLMSKCQLALRDTREAERYAEKAQAVYPEEAQAYQVSGIAKMGQNRFSAAYEEFDSYDQLLPGNPGIAFLKGYTLELTGDQEGAAREYYRYLKNVSQGEQAQFAYERLVNWGYLP
ncbi:peptidase M48 Ste24p [candidate division KSB3 bacterium]|uniref:Peptidase M48 Ste24p n=1 Tax=candidate division KSB3 bacterium TaxID=2044937 RepID=A0A2G6E6Q8_9BACT|nr:MAG: peptidase M48 Ste24p [candidate division KSB3 bacterium]PIE30185.1 MAG: peptidase M48 Ste24p [candidate division KSB3 bacterium]